MITHRNAHRIALAFLACVISTCALLTMDASASTMQARPVTLAQAEVPPSFFSNLSPGAYLDAGDPATGYSCGQGYYFTDISAYTWRGGALSGQTWNTDNTVSIWRDKTGHAVTFDGIRFRNHTHHVVIVAGWCD